MKLLDFMLKRKLLIGLISVLVLAVGSYAALELDKELLPPVNMDGAYIEINAGDMSAIEVERTITTPLEKEIQNIEGVEEVTNTTNIGRSSFNLTFATGRGEEVYKEVESIVTSSTASMTGVKDVVSGQMGTNQSYEFYLDVSGGSMEEMTAFSRDVLEPRLEELPEVRDVSLMGGTEHKVAIKLDREKLTNHGLEVSQIVSLIQQVNTEATLGELSEEELSPTLRWSTNLKSIEDIESLEIATPTGMIPLEDVADVSLEPLESSSFVWKNGSKDFIFVQVGRVAAFTQLEMAEAVRTEIEEIKGENAISGFELTEMVAQADYVKESIDGVTKNIIIGGVIALVILLLFLRNIRATFIIGLAIPTSILLTFAAMWLSDYSFNLLTLIGLGLGIGMMIDSSIVIIESIYRKKEQGLANHEAVLEGTKEVATAVIASMLTTIVVFLPIGILGGDMGKFMIMLSMVVTFTLTSSVIVSFTLIPSLSEKLLKFRHPNKKAKKEGPFMRGYSHLIEWVVKKKRYSLAVIFFFCALFAGSLLLITKVPMTIMPDIFNRYSELVVDIETGVPLEEKEALIQEMDETLSAIGDVESNYVMDDGSRFYTIINMTKGEAITREQEAINEDILGSLRELKNSYPLESVQSTTSGGGGYPVQVNISGEDFDQLKTLAENFSEELQKIEGIVEVTHSMERTSPEQMVVLDQEAIKDEGISPAQIRQVTEQAFLQVPAGEVTIKEEVIPLSLEWAEKTTSETDLLDLKLTTPQGEKSLAAFMTIETIQTPNEITRTNGKRYVSISADIEDADLGSINRQVQAVIDDYQTPTGYSISVAGDLEQQQALIKDMVIVLGLAIFLVYLVMAVQFNHLIHPLIVMSVIPMTVIGVILGLLLTQQELSVMSGMGVVMLIGIVLNNAILLIDRTNQLRQSGYVVTEALIEAGKQRIRPIFMTTLTTVGGMLPLALASGASSSYQAPMATIIISGLLFATFITLLLIPAIYRLFAWTKKGKNAEGAFTKTAS